MKSDELIEIRRAIDDAAEPYAHLDGAIKTILDLVKSRYLTIAHFLLGDAVALSNPAIPTAPTFDTAPAAPTLADYPSDPSFSSAPTKSTAIGLEKWREEVSEERYLSDLATGKIQKANSEALQLYSDALSAWREKCSNDLNKFSQEVNNYRAQQSTTSIKLELRREHARIYLELAKDLSG